MSEYLINDLWNIVLKYLDGDIKSYPDFFENHLDKVNWVCLSENESIPIEFFENHLDKLNWVQLSGNESIPIEFFENHLDKVNWSNLSLNESILQQLNKRKLIIEFEYNE